MKPLLAILTLVALTALSPAVDAQEERRIQEIRCEGLKNRSVGKIFGKISMREGLVFSRSELASDYQSLWETGWFSFIEDPIVEAPSLPAFSNPFTLISVFPA